MKRIGLLLLAVLLCLSLCACGNQDKYKKYDTLIGYIEAGDSGNAINEVLSLIGKNGAEGTEAPEVATTTVEITLDNWQEYFEIRPYEEKRYNVFDELDATNYADAIYLKEKYLSSLTTGGADVAFKVTATKAYCEYDEENNIFVENGAVNKAFSYEVESILTACDLRSQSNRDTYISDGNGQVVAMECHTDMAIAEKCYKAVFTDIDVINVTGTLEFYK